MRVEIVKFPTDIWEITENVKRIATCRIEGHIVLFLDCGNKVIKYELEDDEDLVIE